MLAPWVYFWDNIEIILETLKSKVTPTRKCVIWLTLDSSDDLDGSCPIFRAGAQWPSMALRGVAWRRYHTRNAVIACFEDI